MGSGQPPPSGGAQGMMGGQFAPAFGGFMNDQTAQMGLQVGQKAFMAGQEAMEQSVCCSDMLHLVLLSPLVLWLAN